MLRPKLFTTLGNYSLNQLRADVVAGVIVGIIAMPLAIAFAIASGVSPEKGLITAVVGGLLISALGGSRVQIGGPTGAFVVIVYGIVQTHGIDGLMVATILAGIFLIIMGLARFGGVIKFIPFPVTVGFTAGIALIIFSSQIKDFFGLPGEVPVAFFEKWLLYARHWQNINPYAAAISTVTVMIIVLWKRVTKTIPGSVIALIATTAAVTWFDLPVETIGSRFGEIPRGIPMPHVPDVSLAMIGNLIQPAFTIAILAGIESLLSAVIADGMIGGKHRSNMELVAQGVANLVSPLFGGIPAAGAFARTAANIHNGGRTPVAGMVHAITLLLIMYVVTSWAKLIPLSALAGILFVVAYRMSEWGSIQMILRSPRSDLSVFLITFTLTVVADLTIAIEIGMVLAAFLLINRLSLTTNIHVITGEFADEEDKREVGALDKLAVPKDVEIYEINGPFFFGVTSLFVETMSRLESKPRVRILRMRHVHSIDATAINALRQVFRYTRHQGVSLMLSGVHPQPLAALKRDGIYDLIGKENIHENIQSALKQARNLLDSNSAPG